MDFAGLRDVNWKKHTLKPFQKNFYTEHPAVAKRSDADVEAFRRKHEMIVKAHGSVPVPKPVSTFAEANFPSYVLQELAVAGSGKTLCFLLPAIVHINAQPLLEKGDGPICLVIAPTRELPCQIKKEADKFGYSSNVKNTCVYGGAPRRDQANILREGVEIVICTPGRMTDFLEDGTSNC